MRIEKHSCRDSFGPNVHADDDFALRFASANGHLAIVEIILAAGANVHANNDLEYAAVISAIDASHKAGFSGIGLTKFLEHFFQKFSPLKSKFDEIYKIFDEIDLVIPYLAPESQKRPGLF